MSDGFLGRWSRRKIEAKERTEKDLREEERPDASARETAPDAEAEAVAATPVDEPETLSEEELAALPPLESFTIDTDITPFLRRGVPKALKNAAMRKMWLLDPAIRNYRDVALDYAYDWNTPGGVPGNSGSITSEAARKMLEALLPEEKSAERVPGEQLPGEPAKEPSEGLLEERADPPAESAGDARISAAGPSDDIPEPGSAPVEAPRFEAPSPRAAPSGIGAEEPEIPLRRRRHGGAAPV